MSEGALILDERPAVDDVPLRVRGLTAGYGASLAVRSLSMDVRRRSITALLGPNGAGKTTTLLAISGLLPIRGGSISVLGQDVGGHPHEVARRGLAHVLEGRGLFYELTVKENIALGVRRRQGGVIDDSVALFPALKALLGRRAGVLSGGEQQMVALARAVVSKPSVLLVDEMSLGLAPVIVEQMLPVLRTLCDEQHMAILMVEQHVKLALEVADYVYVLNHGDLQMEGTAAQMRDDASGLEATYLGGGMHRG
jgi:branched-chain amino acid transport system ATP-binding protein